MCVLGRACLYSRISKGRVGTGNMSKSVFLKGQVQEWQEDEDGTGSWRTWKGTPRMLSRGCFLEA
jgi:hypothetical protein